jgi:hypothetical protein
MKPLALLLALLALTSCRNLGTVVTHVEPLGDGKLAVFRATLRQELLFMQLVRREDGYLVIDVNDSGATQLPTKAGSAEQIQQPMR